MITINDVKNIDYDKAVRVITSFIADIVSSTGVKGVVIGLSGGIDSSVTFRLAIEALPRDNVTVLIMPDTRITPEEDVEDALSLAKTYGVKHYLIPIDKIVDAYNIAPFYNYSEKIPTGNLRARIRMNLLYYYANKHNYLVLGTGDRSELLIGYFTKYGDGGVDALPIGCLYKTQVRELGKRLGLPSTITSKPSSPQLWRGHLAEEELGLKYEEIDVILYALFDENIPLERISGETGIEEWKIKYVLEMHRSTRHKRTTPPIPRLPWIQNVIKEI